MWTMHVATNVKCFPTLHLHNIIIIGYEIFYLETFTYTVAMTIMPL